MMSIEFNKSSLMLEYVLSACLSCMEKKGKLSTPWRRSRFVLFLCRKSNLINGLVRLIMTTKRSLNKISPTFNWSSTVALGVSKYPFATIIWKSGAGPTFKIVCRASNRIFLESTPEMALVIALVSMRPSMVNSPKFRAESALFRVFHAMNSAESELKFFWIRADQY